MVEDMEEYHKTSTIISTQVNFSIPRQRWLATYSRKYPQLQFNILSLLSISEAQGNCLIRITGPKINSFYKEFSKEFDSNKYQLIIKETGEILMNMIFDSPWVIWSIIGPQIIILYPITIQNGIITIELIAPLRKIQEVFRKPKWKKLNIKFTVPRKHCANPPNLNEHQKNILSKAMEYGLFDIPRKMSMTEAVTLLEKDTGHKISVSALSENIRRISKKLAECYKNCRDTDEVQIESLSKLTE